MSNIQNSNGNRPAGFHLDKGNAKIAGVCGGLANYYQATDSRILHISVPLGIPPVQFFKLYAE